MRAVIEHESGLILSIKTFRPLWVFPWLSSIWRQFPMATCLATISYEDRTAAERGHAELERLLKGLKIGPKMSEPFQAIESFAKKKSGAGVRSYRIYKGHAVEGKVSVEVEKRRTME
jgi:hypothetical protein